MPLNLAILAENDPTTRLLYVIAVVVLVAGSAIYEKIKKQVAEAQRKQRPPRLPGAPPPRPPVVPPLERQLNDSPFPPPVPPVARPTPSAAPLRPQQQKKRRPQQRVPEPRRRVEDDTSARGRSAAVGFPQGADSIERRAQTLLPGGLTSPAPIQSLAQLRAEQQRRAAEVGVEPVVIRKPTLVELRRAIVLSEVLGPPIGLREGAEF